MLVVRRGWEHDKKRAELLPKAYGKPCPRCGLPMLKGQDLDLGHAQAMVYTGRRVGDRIEHASCNRRDGQRIQREVGKLRRSAVARMRKGLL